MTYRFGDRRRFGSGRLSHAWWVLGCLVGVLLAPASAEAQLFSKVYVSGLSRPLAFVQDPSDSTVQYIVEQGGRIKVVKNGALQSTPFLNLSAATDADGEQGLLGLAFPPDYEDSGRFYVNFTNLAGHTVVARFKRSTSNPLVANPASRFDFMWPGGLRVITQPASNHNGGNMAFGPDGFLYIGMGDGGGSSGGQHRAQDPNSLHGKMLRLDVSVGDSDTRGYQIPLDNPFTDNDPVPALDEIWAFGLRNPWRWSFDMPALGGTGALLIGDVGESSWEEIDYQPPGRGARNYGWRNRQGAHDFQTALPPAYAPLIDPILEYSRSVGRSVTGGFVYRGAKLGGSFYGRYFYADLFGRVWSIRLNVNSTTQEASASNLIEHTTTLGGSATLGIISSFGIDSRGELYLVSLSTGIVFQILNSHPEQPRLAVDTPKANATVTQPFYVAGWGIDAGAAPGGGTGVDFVRVQAFPNPGSGAPPVTFAPQYGIRHPPIGALFGEQFTNSGYRALITGLQPGRYRIAVSLHSTATASFILTKNVDVTVGPPFTKPLIAIDTPKHNASVVQPFLIAGWALDRAATTNTGVDQVRILVSVPGSGTRTVVGNALVRSRPDVAAIYGANFVECGWWLGIGGLAPGTYDVIVQPRSTVTGSSEVTKTIRLTVTN
jgi:glucose/arabinose dehydrogenase